MEVISRDKHVQFPNIFAAMMTGENSVEELLSTKKGLHRLKTVWKGFVTKCGAIWVRMCPPVRMCPCVRIVFVARDMWDSNVSFSRCWLGATALDSQPLAQSAELSRVALGVQVNSLLVEVTCHTWLIFVSLF
jgi:hypothetical protein